MSYFGGKGVPPFGLQLRLGYVPGWLDPVHKFGRNSDIDTASDPEDVWEGGGLYTGQPVQASDAIEVVSNDANDSALGTGCRTAAFWVRKCLGQQHDNNRRYVYLGEVNDRARLRH